MTKTVRAVRVYASAIGVYSLYWNGKKLGREYFATGLTEGKELCYQVYDGTAFAEKENEFCCVLCGIGGRAERTAFLCEIRIEYTDGEEWLIPTDGNWQTGNDGGLRTALFGVREAYDATMSATNGVWRAATRARVRTLPGRVGGLIVTAHERWESTLVEKTADGVLLYDLGETFVGNVHLRLRGEDGQKVSIRFLSDSEVCYEAEYICRSGEQTYVPVTGYAAFRYCLIEGIGSENIEIEGVALYPDVEEREHFLCSDEELNAWQRRAVWADRASVPAIIRGEKPLSDADFILMTWRKYRESGDEEVLKSAYPAIRKYLFGQMRRKLLSFGKKKFVWRSKDGDERETVRASVTAARSFACAARIADLLGEVADGERYRTFAEGTKDACFSLIGEGSFGKTQAAYLTASMGELFTDEAERKKAAQRMADDLEKSGYLLSDGLLEEEGLSLLTEQGYADVAYLTLATSAEQAGKRIHSDFLRRYCTGLTAVEPGYKVFRVEPHPVDGIYYAAADVLSPYGKIVCGWGVENGVITLRLEVPLETTCRVVLPSGRTETFPFGTHTLQEKL